MKTMFLLGAGASVKAGVPDTYEMTKKMLMLFSGNRQDQQYYKVFSFIVGGLLFQKGKDGKNPYDGVNVEEVFNAVQLLANRQSLELAPFVGSWNEMIDLIDLISPYNPNVDKFNEEIYRSIVKTIIKAFPNSSVGVSESELDGALKRSSSLGQAVHRYLSRNMSEWFRKMANSMPSSSYSFKEELTKAIHSAGKISGKGKIFEDTSEKMIINLINLVWIKEYENVSYLKPILSVFEKQKQLCVATLNYDNSIELLTSKNSVECNTGIKDWSETGELENKNNLVFLLKLHGSIDWKLEREIRSSDRPLPQSRIEIGNPDDVIEKYYRPAVIFGQRNKLTAEGPFLDLMHAFQKELSKNEQVVIIGYSFRDDHINEYLTQWINNSSTNRIVVIDPIIESNATEFVLNIRQLLPNRFEFFNNKVEDVLESICEKIVN